MKLQATYKVHVTATRLSLSGSWRYSPGRPEGLNGDAECSDETLNAETIPMKHHASTLDTTSTKALWLVPVGVLFVAMNAVPPIAGYLEMRWPDLAAGGVLFIALFLLGGFVRNADGHRDPLLVFHWVLLATYLLHQFEEHGVDLLGRIYYFQAYANRALAERGLELTSGAILRINTVLIWFAFLLAVWGGRRFLWPGLAAAGLMLTNGFSHIAMAALRGEYNPGLASSVVLFLPIAIAYFRFVSRECRIGSNAVKGAVAYGVAGHLLLPVMIAADAPLIAVFLAAIAPLAANALAERISPAGG
jgi:hypothetical protein